jgi:hypothetical protein
MAKITRVTLHREDGTTQEFTRENSKWLLSVMNPEDNVLSLSGDDINNAYLLRVLENAVVQTMNETHRYGPQP